jgi:hypothetical protein
VIFQVLTYLWYFDSDINEHNNLIDYNGNILRRKIQSPLWGSYPMSIYFLISHLEMEITNQIININDLHNPLVVLTLSSFEKNPSSKFCYAFKLFIEILMQLIVLETAQATVRNEKTLNIKRSMKTDFWITSKRKTKIWIYRFSHNYRYNQTQLFK